ncbi:unnamed protein product [Arabis nemorensis]|uniref:Uncharacterized protein n=1 Tax=Arabis nemorensis TaxID=586526 RepID=A0A565C524_9BRAS|nr:unnamed protein product [Arabis nemorensis]
MRGRGRGVQGRGRGVQGHGNRVREETPAVTKSSREETLAATEESSHNGSQASAHVGHGVDPAVITAAMVEGLRQVFGQQPPPPPPPPAQEFRQDYWRVRDYGNHIDLVERASLTERNIEDENKLLKSGTQKTAKTVEPSRQQHDNRGSTYGKDKGVLCTRCGKSHTGPCMIPLGCASIVVSQDILRRCIGSSWDCRVRQYGQGQYGHVQTNQNREQLPPAPKRQAIAPRAFVAGDHEGVQNQLRVCFNYCRLLIIDGMFEEGISVLV